MSRIHRALARVVLRYRLACARQDVRRQGLQVPTGVWCCPDCGLVVWELDAFRAHGRAHTIP